MPFEIRDVDRAFYAEHLTDWLPPRIIDVHAHVWLKTWVGPETPRGAQWPALVARDNSIEDLLRTYELLLPGQQVTPLIFGYPQRGADLEQTNAYVSQVARRHATPGLLLSSPEETAEELERRVGEGRFLGLKPYLEFAPAHIAADDITIFDFLPHQHLQVADAHGWIVMLHIPRRARLRDPLNLAHMLEIERQAINYATNRAEINQVVYFGNVEPAYGPLSKANLEYNAEVESLYPFDLDKAKELLREAGWWDEDGDGTAEAHGVPDVEDGTPLQVRIVRGRSWQQYSDVWQRQLSMAGFKASIIMTAGTTQDWYGCINQAPANGDVFLDSVVGMSRDWDKDQCGGAMNFGCTCDVSEIQDPIQEYLAAASAAQTMEERADALGQLQMFVMENALEVPIYELYWNAGVISSLKGVKADATGFYYFFYDAYWER